MEQQRINITKRIDQALGKIEKKAKWSVLLCFALITIGLWTTLCTTFERHVGYKLIIVSALALAFMVKSTIDLLNIAKLKKTASRKEQLDMLLRGRKYEPFAKWFLVVQFFLYILVDVLHERTVGMMITGAIIFLLFMFVYLVTYDKTSSYLRSVELENDLRQLAHEEKS